MIKKIIVACLLIAQSLSAFTQNTTKTDSLKKVLDNRPAQDSVRVNMLYNLSDKIFFKDPERAFLYAKQGVELAKKLNWKEGWIDGLLVFASLNSLSSKHDIALSYAMEALTMSEAVHNNKLAALAHSSLSEDYRLMATDSLSEYHTNKYLEIANLLKDEKLILDGKVKLATLYFETGRLQKAKVFIDQALKMAIEQQNEGNITRLLGLKADVKFEQKDYKAAIKIYKQVLSMLEKSGEFNTFAYVQLSISRAYLKLNSKDSAGYFASSALETTEKYHLKKEKVDAYYELYNNAYAFGEYKNAFDYLIIYDSLNAEMNMIQAAQNAALTRATYEQQKKDALALVAQEKKDSAARRLRNLLYLALSFFAMLVGFLTWNNRQKQKSNKRIEAAYATLKSTQSQLIQSEKMASLGELTAGIAHEIQNPLNFVNNFSEVSNELIDEMNDELANGDLEEVKLIASDIKQNLEKINHHGKRADAIVKGMLQHSQSSSGKKESTDINKLADEYLRLAYHGLRAKDKSFNATIKTDFDESIGNINIVPQDIGRVILNLINNALYAAALPLKRGLPDPDYKHEPTVWVSTSKIPPPVGGGGGVLISVRDNGPGIPENIIDKIFQPFFTTKPTGQGTGLGLSLAYDIVKAHGGELKVESKEGEGTEFTIQLPLQLVK